MNKEFLGINAQIEVLKKKYSEENFKTAKNLVNAGIRKLKSKRFQTLICNQESLVILLSAESYKILKSEKQRRLKEDLAKFIHQNLPGLEKTISFFRLFQNMENYQHELDI